MYSNFCFTLLKKFILQRFDGIIHKISAVYSTPSYLTAVCGQNNSIPPPPPPPPKKKKAVYEKNYNITETLLLVAINTIKI